MFHHQASSESPKVDPRGFRTALSRNEAVGSPNAFRIVVGDIRARDARFDNRHVAYTYADWGFAVGREETL